MILYLCLWREKLEHLPTWCFQNWEGVDTSLSRLLSCQLVSVELSACQDLEIAGRYREEIGLQKLEAEVGWKLLSCCHWSQLEDLLVVANEYLGLGRLFLSLYVGSLRRLKNREFFLMVLINCINKFILLNHPKKKTLKKWFRSNI